MNKVMTDKRIEAIRLRMHVFAAKELDRTQAKIDIADLLEALDAEKARAAEAEGWNKIYNEDLTLREKQVDELRAELVAEKTRADDAEMRATQWLDLHTSMAITCGNAVIRKEDVERQLTAANARLASARDEAIEKCAVLLDKNGLRYSTHEGHVVRANTCYVQAEAIRALKSTTQEQGENNDG